MTLSFLEDPTKSLVGLPSTARVTFTRKGDGTEVSYSGADLEPIGRSDGSLILNKGIMTYTMEIREGRMCIDSVEPFAYTSWQIKRGYFICESLTVNKGRKTGTEMRETPRGEDPSASNPVSVLVRVDMEDADTHVTGEAAEAAPAS